MKRLKKILSLLGPGFITGASDDDPSGIATYSQTGAQFGFTQLWTAPFSFPFMTVVQEMCGRIGMVTGNGLSGVMRKHYAKPLLYTAVCILVVANIVNVGANLGAMAASAEMVLGLPFTFWLIVMAIVILLLEVFVPYPSYARMLKYLTFSLFAYIISAFAIQLDWSTVLRSTLVPTFSLDKSYLLNIIAILGTTISPYLFFWQADVEVEEEIKEHKIKAMGKGIPRVTKHDISEMRIDTVIGMFFSNLVMFFIIVTTGATLHASGITQIETADQAAQALRPVAGDIAYILFALGIIGTGFLAVPILAGSAAYALSEAIGWKAGLYIQFKRAHGFYGVITIAMLVGLLLNFTSIPPFRMLYYTAILNGIAAPPLIFLLLHIANNKKIMGHHTNSKASNIMGGIIAVVMSGAALFLLASVLFS